MRHDLSGMWNYFELAVTRDLGRSCLLIRPGVPQQIPVEFLPAAVKTFNQVIGAELFNAASFAH